MGLRLGQVGLCRLNTLFRVVEGMHTPRTVVLDLFDDFAGLVDKKHGFRSLFRREFGDFKQLVDTSQSFDVLLVAFLNRVLPLHDFAVDLFLVLIDQALIEFRLERLWQPLPSTTVKSAMDVRAQLHIKST